MLFSYNWLKEYFDAKLPEPKKLAELVTACAYQVEEISEKDGDYIFNVDILPNRAHDSLCMNGFAKQVGAILGIPCKNNLPEEIVIGFESKYSVKIEDPSCARYVLREVEGIKIGKSPKELQEKIEALGQRSINNLVDITNLVMLELNQPMHAFDAEKVAGEQILVRLASTGEKMTTLDNKELNLNENDLVIADSESVLALAGIKGGKKAEIDSSTKNILLEAACFNQTKVRLTSSRVDIKTDSSKRFENGISPDLALQGILRASELIKKYASDANIKFGNVVDEFPRKPKTYKVGISAQEVSDIAGVEISEKEIEEILKRLNFKFEKVKVGEKIIEVAKSLIGTPYKYASSITYDAPGAFDCSAFISYVFSEAGIRLPRMAVDQFVYSERISKEELQPGDLIFANSLELVHKIDYESIEYLKGTKVESGVDHVGIYVGNNEIIHTSKNNEHGVEIQNLDNAKQFDDIIGYRHPTNFAEERYVVEVPTERLDIRIKEDLAEEILLLYGYQNIPERPLDEVHTQAKINPEFALIQEIRVKLAEAGFSEIMTYSLVSKGEIETLKPVSPEKAWLRTNLAENMEAALVSNSRRMDLVGMKNVLTFEIGKIFTKKAEELRLSIGAVTSGAKTSKETKAKLAEAEKIILGISLNIEKISATDSCLEFSLQKASTSFATSAYASLPASTEGKYKILSPYPFIVRDVSLWAEAGTNPETVEKIIAENSGDLLWRITLFDVFEKTFEDGTKKVSLAFRIVLQSQEKTLTDEEVAPITDKIYSALKKQNYEIR